MPRGGQSRRQCACSPHRGAGEVTPELRPVLKDFDYDAALPVSIAS